VTLRFLFTAISFAIFFTFNAQDFGMVKGNLETTFQGLKTDSAINALAPPSKTLINSYINIYYTYKGFKAGGRFESYLPALQGYPKNFVGNGIGMRFAGYSDEKLDVTLGNFYDQFGSGMIFRAYENRNLGYDNAMDGIRLAYRPKPGIILKAVYGKNRLSFTNGFKNADGLVRGLDGEICLNDAFKFLDSMPLNITIGSSFVSKFQKDENEQYILPENVASYGGRMALKWKRWSTNFEYIHKENDPSADNNYSYNSGHAALMNLGYSQKGFAVLFSAKSVDNFSYRSDRTQDLQNALINYLPSLNRTHTYNLVATLYPYATQPLGEIAYQGEIIYTFKKNKPGEVVNKFVNKIFTGKSPATFTVNFSTAYGNKQFLKPFDAKDSSRIFYKATPFVSSGKMYWQDFNIEYRKKLSKSWTLATSYYNITVNNDVSKVTEDAKGLIHTNIAVIDLAYQINEKHTVRAELQSLMVGKDRYGKKKDKGDWATGLVEWTISPSWFFAVMDQFNYGNEIKKNQLHYLIGTVGYIHDASRFSVSFGRQRAGLFCVGGVCRFVPANNGVTFNFTHTF
jgi:hypothetical protein